jgi:putative Ca2+/H+ antiporter (TMEM165/GDT1 family)
MISIPLVLSTFGIIFLAELPDKTALSSLVLATRYRANQVIIGAWLAMLAQTVVAVFAGSLLTLLPAMPVRIVTGLGFLLFAALALHRTRKEETREAREVRKEEVEELHEGKPAWLASFLVVFAAEWGDLSQLATAGLVAHQGHALSIGIGAVLGLWTVMAIAAYAGSQIGKHLSERFLNRASALIFTLIGIVMLVTAFT